MHVRTLLVATLTLFAILGVATTASAATALVPQNEAQRAIGGTWIYVADRTEGRSVKEQGPRMSPKITIRVEKDAVSWERPRGDERYPTDGSVNEVKKTTSMTRWKGSWKGDVFTYDTDIIRLPDESRIALIRREFRVTEEGLILTISSPPDKEKSVSLYRHVEDIELPKPAKAKIDDLAWLADAWVGMRGKRSIEERWGPPLGGAMLGVSRTISRGKMVAFEFLRIVERDGGLVYFAQPGGRTATEYVLTQLDGKRAVFDNPRHDHPQRITYTLADDGSLAATVGWIHGGDPRPFEYKRESK